MRQQMVLAGLLSVVSFVQSTVAQMQERLGVIELPYQVVKDMQLGGGIHHKYLDQPGLATKSSIFSEPSKLIRTGQPLLTKPDGDDSRRAGASRLWWKFEEWNDLRTFSKNSLLAIRAKVGLGIFSASARFNQSVLQERKDDHIYVTAMIYLVTDSQRVDAGVVALPDEGLLNDDVRRLIKEVRELKERIDTNEADAHTTRLLRTKREEFQFKYGTGFLRQADYGAYYFATHDQQQLQDLSREETIAELKAGFFGLGGTKVRHETDSMKEHVKKFLGRTGVQIGGDKKVMTNISIEEFAALFAESEQEQSWYEAAKNSPAQLLGEFVPYSAIPALRGLTEVEHTKWRNPEYTTDLDYFGSSRTPRSCAFVSVAAGWQAARFSVVPQLLPVGVIQRDKETVTISMEVDDVILNPPARRMFWRRDRQFANPHLKELAAEYKAADINIPNNTTVWFEIAYPRKLTEGAKHKSKWPIDQQLNIELPARIEDINLRAFVQAHHGNSNGYEWTLRGTEKEVDDFWSFLLEGELRYRTVVCVDGVEVLALEDRPLEVTTEGTDEAFEDDHVRVKRMRLDGQQMEQQRELSARIGFLERQSHRCLVVPTFGDAPTTLWPIGTAKRGQVLMVQAFGKATTKVGITGVGNVTDFEVKYGPGGFTAEGIAEGLGIDDATHVKPYVDYFQKTSRCVEGDGLTFSALTVECTFRDDDTDREQKSYHCVNEDGYLVLPIETDCSLSVLINSAHQHPRDDGGKLRNSGVFRVFVSLASTNEFTNGYDH